MFGHKMLYHLDPGTFQPRMKPDNKPIIVSSQMTLEQFDKSWKVKAKHQPPAMIFFCPALHPLDCIAINYMM